MPQCTAKYDSVDALALLVSAIVTNTVTVWLYFPVHGEWWICIGQLSNGIFRDRKITIAVLESIGGSTEVNGGYVLDNPAMGWEDDRSTEVVIVNGDPRSV